RRSGDRGAGRLSARPALPGGAGLSLWRAVAGAGVRGLPAHASPGDSGRQRSGAPGETAQAAATRSPRPHSPRPAGVTEHLPEKWIRFSARRCDPSMTSTVQRALAAGAEHLHEALAGRGQRQMDATSRPLVPLAALLAALLVLAAPQPTTAQTWPSHP